MSWLTDLFDSGDNAKKDARRKAQLAQQAEQKRQQQEAAAAEQRRQTGISSGIGGASQYFSSLGADPGRYSGDITNAITSAVNAGNTDLTGVAKQLYNDLTNSYRTRNQRAISQFAPVGFEDTAITSSADDDIINALLGEGRGGAEQYVTNLKKRGVISDAGFNAALGDVGNQEAGVRSLLEDLGGGFISSGRTDLRNIANKGFEAAGSLGLDQAFDPGSFSSRIDQALADFTGGLEGKFRAAAPKNLFDTSGLANVAGVAQGAGNRAFNPKAVAGVLQDNKDKEEDKNTPLVVF